MSVRLNFVEFSCTRWVVIVFVISRRRFLKFEFLGFVTVQPVVGTRFLFTVVCKCWFLFTYQVVNPPLSNEWNYNIQVHLKIIRINNGWKEIFCSAMSFRSIFCERNLYFWIWVTMFSVLFIYLVRGVESNLRKFFIICNFLSQYSYLIVIFFDDYIKYISIFPITLSTILHNNSLEFRAASFDDLPFYSFSFLLSHFTPKNCPLTVSSSGN